MCIRDSFRIIQQPLVSALVLLAGTLSLCIMFFSPSMYISGQRTSFVFCIALVVLCVKLIREQRCAVFPPGHQRRSVPSAGSDRVLLLQRLCPVLLSNRKRTAFSGPFLFALFWHYGHRPLPDGPVPAHELLPVHGDRAFNGVHQGEGVPFVARQHHAVQV